MKVPPRDRFRNKTERAYALYLDALIHAGTVRSWKYECVSVRLGEGARYCPDFFVVLADDVIEIHEIKGFAREAARVRFIVARDLFPQWRWRMIVREKGQWTERKV